MKPWPRRPPDAAAGLQPAQPAHGRAARPGRRPVRPDRLRAVDLVPGRLRRGRRHRLARRLPRPQAGPDQHAGPQPRPAGGQGADLRGLHLPAARRRRRGWLTPWMVTVVVARELIITGLRSFLENQRGDVRGRLARQAQDGACSAPPCSPSSWPCTWPRRPTGPTLSGCSARPRRPDLRHAGRHGAERPAVPVAGAGRSAAEQAIRRRG